MHQKIRRVKAGEGTPKFFLHTTHLLLYLPSPNKKPLHQFLRNSNSSGVAIMLVSSTGAMLPEISKHHCLGLGLQAPNLETSTAFCHLALWFQATLGVT